MARGQAGAADTQLGKTNDIGSQQQSQADTLRNKLVPGYTSLADTGYLSPADKAAATTNEMGAATAPFQSANFGAANRASATNNASDLTAQQDQLALEQGQTAGGAAANLQTEQMSNQLQGMYGLQGEEAASRGEAQGMYGLGPSTLNARAAGGGWSQGFKDVGQTVSSFGK
jgi:hypothetical protein